VLIVLPVMVLLSLALLLQRKYIQAVSFWGGFLVTRLVTDGLKYFIARPRPGLNELGYIPPGWDALSFPSGHTTSACFVYGFLLLLGLRSSLSAPLRQAAVVLTVFIVVLVGMSRILLGMHFPSDVIGGLLSGGMGLVIAVAINDRWNGFSGQSISA
jgi:undecaprenyl-diphosphatase